MPRTALHDRLAAIAGSLSNREVGERTGIHHESVRRYLSGQTPSVEFLVGVCEEFGVNGEWLLTGRGPMRSAEVATRSLKDAKTSQLLAAVAETLERMQDRVDRLETFIHTLETRLRAAKLSPQDLEPDDDEAPVEAPPDSPEPPPDPPVSRKGRVRGIADAVAQRPRQGAR